MMMASSSLAPLIKNGLSWRMNARLTLPTMVYMKRPENCVFCKIVQRKLPAFWIFDDDLVLCFLNIMPINFGHALMIPKDHHTSLTTVPEPVLSRMMSVAPGIAQAIVREVDGDGFNLHLANGQCAGQAVPHVHLHIVPRLATDGFSWGWRGKACDDEGLKKEFTEKIIRRLKK